MNGTILVLLLVSLLGSVGSTVWYKVKSNGLSSKLEKQETLYNNLSAAVEERIKREQELAKASSELEEQLSALRKSRTRVEIVKVKEYENSGYNCPVPSTGILLINGAITEINRATPNSR